MLHNRPGAMRGLCPPRGGGNDIVFFGKVIGYRIVTQKSALISGELFGLRVKNNFFI